MLTVHFRIILTICIAIYFMLILYCIRKGMMSLKYSLLWMLTGIVMLVFAIFPKLATFIAHAMGVYSDTNMLFFIGIAFVILIILSLTVIVTGQTEKIRNLASSQALLEKRIRELEEENRREDTHA